MPSVLFINLLRFEYNRFTKKQCKLNKKYVFYDKLEFKDFTIDKIENLYNLQAVVVHSGNIDFGHYYSFIKTNQSLNKWHKFDDNLVVECDENEVFSRGFGGNGNESAYILVYVKIN